MKNALRFTLHLRPTMIRISAQLVYSVVLKENSAFFQRDGNYTREDNRGGALFRNNILTEECTASRGINNRVAFKFSILLDEKRRSIR